MSDIERAIIVSNPERDIKPALWHQIGQIATNGITISDVPTCLRQNRLVDQMALSLGERHEGTVFLVAGGDGTANMVLNAALSARGRDVGLNTVPIVPLRGGNANDIASMLNKRKSIAKILEAERCQLHPLEITFEDRPSVFAFGYFSIGGTAAAAHELDKLPRSPMFTQKLREVAVVLQATAGHPKFRYSPNPDAEGIPITDIAFFRGNRIAKYGRPGANLHVPKFNRQVSDATRQWEIASKLVSMGLGLSEMDKDLTYCTFSTGAFSPENRYIPMQYDGEAKSLRTRNHIGVSISKHYYTSLSTTAPTT